MPVTQEQLKQSLRGGGAIVVPPVPDATVLVDADETGPPHEGPVNLLDARYADSWLDAEDLIAVIREVDDPHPHGLRLQGVIVTGELDLSGFEIPFPLMLQGVHFLGPVRLRNARTRTLDLEQSFLHGGLEARNLQLQGDLLGSGLVSDAEIDLLCATVTGQVELPKATLRGVDRCLSGDAMSVGGGMFLADVRAHGTVGMVHSSINIQLDLCNAELWPPAPAVPVGPAAESETSFSLLAEGLQLAGSLMAWGLKTHGEVHLGSAEIAGALRLNAAEFVGPRSLFSASQLHVRQDLDAEHVESDGEIALNGARIGGQLLLRDVRLRGAAAHLSAYRLHVDGDMFCRRLHAEGEIRLSGAVITRQLDLRDVQLAAGGAVVAQTLRVGKDMTCDRLRGRVELRLRGAVINGRLDLTEARITRLDGADLQVDGSLTLDSATFEEPLTLTRSRIGSLQVSERHTSWPRLGSADGWRLGGVSRELIRAPRATAKWLSSTGSSQPFQEMARVFDADGHPSAAKWLRYRAAVNSSANSHPLPRAGRLVYKATTGLGFYPGITLVWLILIFAAALALGSDQGDDFTTPRTPIITTAIDADPSLTPAQRSLGMVPAAWWTPEWSVAKFSAVRHALAIAVPVSDLGGTQPWSPPTTWVWYVFSLLKGLAWIFTTLLLAGISGLLRRSS